MITREQIEEIQTESREKGVSIKKLLEERGIPAHQYFWWKRKYSKREVAAGFLPVAGTMPPAVMSMASGAATITGTVANAGTFFAYYPKSTYAATAQGGVLRIRTTPSPASGTTFDPAADVLVSETFDVVASGSATAPATVRFKRLGAFKASLDAKEGLVEFPLQHASDFTAASPAAGGNNGDCTVRIIGNEVFILAMHTDCGLSLFKMSLDD